MTTDRASRPRARWTELAQPCLVGAALVGLLLVGPASATGAAPAAARITVNGSQFQPGQTLTLGLDAQNPVGNPAVDLYVGLFLPGGQAAVFLSTGGTVAGIVSLATPALFPPAQSAPPGLVLNAPTFFQFTFPATGVPPGTYQAFAALVRQGAFQTGRIDASAILALDERPFVFSPGGPPSTTNTPSPGPGNIVIPLFQKPFQGEFRLANFFDHNLPFEFEDTNGFLLTWWGERTNGIDGHDGYDWSMPEGTPLLAVAEGTVTLAGQTPPISCPPLNQSVAGQRVSVLHIAPNGEQFQSEYAHVSRIDVQVGQTVQAGQQIALSGNVGCSTGPHLHFAVRRMTNTNSGRGVRIDPYGWEGPGPDPWGVDPRGAQSVWLWRDGQAPALFREVRLPPSSVTGSPPVDITAVRWMGVKDDQNPNNQFVELALDPRFAPSGSYDLSAVRLRNTRGDEFTFPAGFTLPQDRPVRVYSGAGQNSATDLFWNLGRGAWEHLAGDCAHLVRPDGVSNLFRFRFNGFTGDCR